MCFGKTRKYFFFTNLSIRYLNCNLERECEAHDYSKTDRRTDGQTDRRTNGQTDWESVKKVEINVREKQRREKKTIMCVCVRERVRQRDRQQRQI
jgi:hypothetical protein